MHCHSHLLDIADQVYYSRKTLFVWLVVAKVGYVARLRLQFEIQPTSGVPIYRQLMDQIRALIASGRLAPGEIVPSVRQMAEELEINLMTVSKAYARLEADGVLERDRGVGMRVKSLPAGGSLAERQKQLKPALNELTTQAWRLKLTDEQVISLVQQALKDRPQ